MKKYLILISIICVTSTGYSQKNDFSRWSFSAETGFNRFDGDITQTVKQIFPTSFTESSFGASVEYALTPVWGLATEYYYFPLSGKGSIGDFTTKLHTASFNATINFSRLIIPKTTTKVCVYGSIGLGVASYISKLTEPGMSEKKSPTCFAGSVPFSLALEYNFSRPFALLAKVNYRSFTKDNLDGVPYKGVTNDAVASITVGARLKFNALKKKHLRNITVEEYSPNEEMLLGLANAKRINALDTTLKSLGKKVDGIDHRVDSLEIVFSNDGPDSDKDGVPDQRDLSPNTPANTCVDFWGRPIQINVNNNTTNNYYTDVPSVYFGFDQVELTDEALISISKIAKKMLDNPKLMVEIRGYCDHAGSNPYNNLLSQRRADRVKGELVRVWSIDPRRIISNGKGKVVDPEPAKIKYSSSRRCDFFFDR